NMLFSAIRNWSPLSTTTSKTTALLIAPNAAKIWRYSNKQVRLQPDLFVAILASSIIHTCLIRADEVLLTMVSSSTFMTIQEKHMTVQIRQATLQDYPSIAPIAQESQEL